MYNQRVFYFLNIACWTFSESAVVASDGVGVLKAAQKMLRIESDHDAHMEAKKHKDSLYSATIPDDYCWVNETTTSSSKY